MWLFIYDAFQWSQVLTFNTVSVYQGSLYMWCIWHLSPFLSSWGCFPLKFALIFSLDSWLQLVSACGASWRVPQITRVQLMPWNPHLPPWSGMPAYQNQASTEVWRFLGSFGDSTPLLMPMPMSHGLNFRGLIALVECGSPSPWSMFFTNVLIMLYSVFSYVILWSACEGPGKNPVGDLIRITLNWQMNSSILSLSSYNGNSFWYL